MRTAIVTGAAQGIGRAIAERLHVDGMHVVIVDVDEVAGEATSVALGSGAQFLACDISDEAQVADLYMRAAQTHGAVDVVVNNAGIIRDNMIWRMSAAEFDTVIRVNLRGTWLMCREAAKLMRAQGHGRIVNIASRAWLGNPGQTNYSASKAGIVGMTRALALEVGRNGVTANIVAPGLIDTPMTRGLTDDVRERLINAQPTRTIGSPADVADAVSYLASERASFVTGQVIYVDGGKHIGAGL
jgi:3-oxoacyl-[acyl-carrier protein] reductase